MADSQVATMLRRFNSLIKGPKGGQISDDELSELHVSLRPALSVDSSLFTSSQHHHVNPLQQQLARAREESLTRARSTRTSPGQTSLNADLLQQGSEDHQQAPGRANGLGFVIGRVPEERSWKEGYEHGTHNFPSSLDSPSKPSPEQPNTELRAGENHQSGENGPFRPVSAPTDFPRVLRTSSGAVVNPSRTTSSDLHTVVEIPDAQDDSVVDLENVRKSVLTTGPGRTISSWSTDSAAEHCRICQTHTEEPLIELGCLCRGEMSKSHKSCIEMWFKNKGTNKCEVCQHVASNIPAPESSPAPHFWVWRLGGAYGTGQPQAAQVGARRVGISPIMNRPVLLMIVRNHPLIPIMWLGLLAFMTYLFVDAINTSTIGYAAMPIGFLFGLLFDVLVSIFLGASALPVNIIIGVLVVLGLGTAVRLVLEYVQERNVQRNIRLMELIDNPANEDSAEGADRPAAQNGPSAV